MDNVIPLSEDEVAALRAWFTTYVHSFPQDDAEMAQAFSLKEAHSLRVRDEALAIGRSLNLRPDQMRLVEAMSLLHDVGRFAQFARYRTLSDRKSEDHALLGVRVLEEEGPLDALAPQVRHLILCAITYHNRPALPADESEPCLFYAKLLRDADKLDIWRVVIAYYRQMHEQRSTVIEMGLADTPGISPAVYEDLMSGQIVQMTHINNLNDFRLLQAGWVYDLNFPWTRKLVQERGYLDELRTFLPDLPQVEEIFSTLRARLTADHHVS